MTKTGPCLTQSSDGAGDEVRFFSASDGTSIACTVIRPKTDPVAVVAFIHDIAVASRLYTPMADSLAGQGYIVIMMDIRGHGYSKGEPGDVPAGASLVKDARDFFPLRKRGGGGRTAPHRYGAQPRYVYMDGDIAVVL